MLYEQYSRSRGLQPGSQEEKRRFTQIQTREDGTRYTEYRGVPVSSARSRSPALRRSARLQHQALFTDFEMPGLLTPPESPPGCPTVPAPIPMRGYPDWPSWYDALSAHFALQAPRNAVEHPGMNCVERALLHGALSASQGCESDADWRALFLHIIRDAWMAAILCRNATKDPEL